MEGELCAFRLLVLWSRLQHNRVVSAAFFLFVGQHYRTLIVNVLYRTMLVLGGSATVSGKQFFVDVTLDLMLNTLCAFFALSDLTGMSTQAACFLIPISGKLGSDQYYLAWLVCPDISVGWYKF